MRQPRRWRWLVVGLVVAVGPWTATGTAVATEGQGRFVDHGGVHHSDIEAMAAAGVTDGCNPPDNDRFCPRDRVSRAQMASFLARAFGWEAPTTTTATAALDSTLVYSTARDRSGPAALDGSTLSGDVYIYAHRLGSKVRQVVFHLDGKKVQTEKTAPYDFEGGDSSPRVTDTSKLDDGEHTIKAVVKYSNGSQKTYSATFRVNNDGRREDPPSDDPPGGGGDPPSPPPASCDVSSADLKDAVRVSPGDNLAQKVSSNGSGTVFVLKAGVHKGQSVQPKSGNAFVGEGGAVLDGQGKEFAFSKGGRNVTVANLEIKNYNTKLTYGAVGPGPSGWCVEGNNIHSNAAAGVKVSGDWKVVGNNIHHNDQYGINGSGDDVVIEGNEIAYNGGGCSGCTHREGGTKFVNTTNLVVRGNYSHHNDGPGLWTDIDNIDTLYDGNRVVANNRAGILVEISYDTTIRNNDVRENGRQDFWVTRAGILVNSSPNVEIYGNTVANNGAGIMARQSNRGTGDFGALQVKNLRVHHNDIAMDEGRTGIWSEAGNEVFSRNNKFYDNTYDLAGGGDYFWWGTEGSGSLNLSEWLSEGHS